MMEKVNPRDASAAAAGLSFLSFMCLFLVNLGAPIINSIFIASLEAKSTVLGSSAGLVAIFGVYGGCVKTTGRFTTSACSSGGLDNDDFDFRSGGTKFLLAMHAIGVITSFMLFCIGMYARQYKPIPQKVSWILALFSSLIILLALSGQIDNFLQIKRSAGSLGTTTLGASGFVLVFLPLIFSLISVIAFYIGDRAVVAEGGNINGPGNMASITNNQSPPVPQYQQQSFSQPQYNNQQFPPPQSYPNSQYDQHNSFQSLPPQSYPNSQYNAKQPPPPQSYTNHQPYSSTDHEPVV